MDLITHRVPPGVDDAAKVKASFLAAVAHGDIAVGLVSKAKAINADAIGYAKQTEEGVQL